MSNGLVEIGDEAGAGLVADDSRIGDDRIAEPVVSAPPDAAPRRRLTARRDDKQIAAAASRAPQRRENRHANLVPSAGRSLRRLVGLSRACRAVVNPLFSTASRPQPCRGATVLAGLAKTRSHTYNMPRNSSSVRVAPKSGSDQPKRRRSPSEIVAVAHSRGPQRQKRLSEPRSGGCIGRRQPQGVLAIRDPDGEAVPRGFAAERPDGHDPSGR